MKKTFLLLVALFLNIAVFSQKIVTVSVDSNTDYKSIQEAINNATYGDIVKVYKGYYYEHIVMKNGVSLLGIDRPYIKAEDNGTAVVMASDCFLSNFFIANSGSNEDDFGILVKDVKNGIIANNIIANNPNCGIFIDNSQLLIYKNFIAVNSNVAISVNSKVNLELCFNILTKNGNYGLQINSSDLISKIYNNDFYKCSTAIELNAHATDKVKMNIFNNIFYDNFYAISRPSTFTDSISYNCFFMNNFDNNNWESNKNENLDKTNIFKDPLFYDVSSFDYSIIKTSPCINTGLNGSVIGRYGNSNNQEKSNLQNINISKDIKAKYVINLKGNALNYTAGYKSSEIKAIIYSDDLENFKIKGQFDNATLYGSFEMTGKVSKISKGIITIEFEQSELLTDYLAGFPIDYKLPFNLTLKINQGIVYGSYTIGTILPIVDYEQNGEFIFKDVKSNFDFGKIK